MKISLLSIHTEKQVLEKILICFFIFITILTILNPSISFRLGNLFFGGKSYLYNTVFADFFYTRAAYPLFGKEVPYAHYQLSRVCFIVGDLPCSLREANKELEVFPTSTLTYYMLGLTYGYMGLEQNAIDAFSTYIEHYPDTWAAKNDKAWLQFRTGDIYGALETIEFAARTQPDNPWLANTYGVMLMNTGRLKEAKEYLTRGLLQANHMTGNDWGYAYPGNDPRVYQLGLDSMKKSFETNLALIEEKLKSNK